MERITLRGRRRSWDIGLSTLAATCLGDIALNTGEREDLGSARVHRVSSDGAEERYSDTAFNDAHLNGEAILGNTSCVAHYFASIQASIKMPVFFTSDIYSCCVYGKKNNN